MLENYKTENEVIDFASINLSKFRKRLTHLICAFAQARFFGLMNKLMDHYCRVHNLRDAVPEEVKSLYFRSIYKYIFVHF